MFLLCSGIARTQTTYFNIQFDYDSIWNTVFGIVETDSLYLATGVFVSPSTYDTGYVLKLTKSGEFAGLRKIDFYPGNKLRDITPSPTGDAVDIYGIHHNGIDDIENVDLFLCRMDNHSLDTLRVQSFGIPNFGDYANTALIRRTSDNGIVLTGYRFAPGQKGKLLLLKTDSLLNQVFMKTFSKSNQDNHTGFNVIETSDKGFIMVGSRSFNTYDLQGSYLKVDSLGNLLWWKDIVPQGDEEFVILYNIAKKENGNYLVTGEIKKDEPSVLFYEKYLVLEINEDGEVLWRKEYGDVTYDDVYWRGLTLCADGNYLTCGLRRENIDIPDRKEYGTVVKLTPGGEILWERKYTVSTEGKLYDVFHKVIPTSDGGIIACGSTWGDSLTRENSWIVKMDSLGCLEPGCDSISTGVIELPVGENSPIKIYPNPTSGHLTVEAQKGKVMEAVKIYDLQGRRLVNEEYGLGKASLSFDLSDQPPGGYFCSALVGGVWVTRQFILKN